MNSTGSGIPFVAKRVATALSGFWLLFLCLALSACQTSQIFERKYNRQQMLAAQVMDYASLRYFPESQSHLAAWSGIQTNPPVPEDGTFDVLALSSGGPDGAWSAGILAGWANSHTMPEFEIVTGVSTGAIIAPFVFVGPQYNQQIEDFYVTSKARDALGPLRVLHGLAGKGFYSKRQMRKLLQRFYTPQLMSEIAAAHYAGRRLFIVTGNFDAQEPVVWDMGRIAAIGTPAASDLFRQIIEAAIGVPVAFEPVAFNVTANGKTYTELHGDAGLLRYYYVDFDLIPPVYRNSGNANVHVILNKVYQPAVSPMKASFGGTVERAVNEFTHTSLQNQLRLDWREAANRGANFRYAPLPQNHEVKSSLDFEPGYMKETFNKGFNGYANYWRVGEP